MIVEYGRAEYKKEKSKKDLQITEIQRKARAKALRLLEHMDRTEKGLSQKLLQAGFSEELTEDAIQYVKSFGYLNDERYAQAFIRGRIRNKSRQQIFQELQKRGADHETIQEAWESVTEFEEPDERENIRREMKKRYGEEIEMEEKELRRMQGYFARRGYAYEDVTAVMRELGIRRKRENFA